MGCFSKIFMHNLQVFIYQNFLATFILQIF